MVMAFPQDPMVKGSSSRQARPRHSEGPSGERSAHAKTGLVEPLLVEAVAAVDQAITLCLTVSTKDFPTVQLQRSSTTDHAAEDSTLTDPLNVGEAMSGANRSTVMGTDRSIGMARTRALYATTLNSVLSLIPTCLHPRTSMLVEEVGDAEASEGLLREEMGSERTEECRAAGGLSRSSSSRNLRVPSFMHHGYNGAAIDG